MTKHLYLAAMASLLAGNAAMAHPTLPTHEQLAEWDQRFLPGQYRLEQYDVDAFGKPLPQTTRLKAAAQCVSEKELRSVSRGPVSALFFWKCDLNLERASVDNATFQVFTRCGGSKAKPVVAFAAVSISADQQTVTNAFVRAELDRKKPPRALHASGGRMTRIGDCSAAEAQAKKGPFQLLADEWDSSGKPMAQDLAKCLRLIDKGDHSIAYATCRATVGLGGMAGTEAEVVLLTQLGLLARYVDEDQQLGFYRQALAAAERFHGASSPAVLEPLVNVAAVLMEKQKAFTEAAPLLERAVDLGSKSTDKSVQAKAVFHYALWVDTLGKAGDKPAALAAARRAAEFAVAVLGPLHEDTGSAWTRAGLLERDAGNLQAARDYFVKSLQLWEAAKIPAYVHGAKEKIAQVDALMKGGSR